MRSHNKTFFSKVPKILAELNKIFNFEKFVIYVLQYIYFIGPVFNLMLKATVYSQQNILKQKLAIYLNE